MRLASLALASLVVGCHPAPAKAPPSPPLPAPRLVVLIVIDQLPAWGLEARRANFTHGLDGLLRQGVVWNNARYPYAITFTAPGHAAIGTGAPPRLTGIIANSWYRRALATERAAETDEASPLLGLDGAPLVGQPGASGVALRVEGLSEALRRGDPRARSVVISGKARSGCFVAGGQPDVALWYEPAARAMTTSTAYGALPAWAVAHAAAHPVARFLGGAWGLADPDVVARLTGEPDDDGPGESPGSRFPHRLGAEGDPARAIRNTPFLDTIEVDAAIAAVDGEHLGADDAADLLAISFSAHDYAGHQWGQESWEMLDLERRLDRELARLFDALDARLGHDGYAVVLTSDHGATRMPERSGGLRISPRALAEAAERAATGVLGPGAWVAAVSSSMIYGSPALLAAAPADRDAALAAMMRAVDEVAGVKRVVRMDRWPDGCAGLSDDDALVCASSVPGESGELYVWPDDGNLVTSYPAGTSHDPPSDDDRRVAIVVRAPGVAPRAIDASVSALAVTATVAKLLGVPAPASAAAPLEY